MFAVKIQQCETKHVEYCETEAVEKCETKVETQCETEDVEECWEEDEEDCKWVDSDYKAILDLVSTEDSFSGCRVYYFMVDYNNWENF